MATAASGCSDETVTLDFSHTRGPTRPGAAGAADVLHIGIAAMRGPEETYLTHAALIQGIVEKVGRRTQLVQRRTYEEMNRALLDGEVDVAWICTGAYMSVRDRVTLLAVPVFDGHATYRSVIITRFNRYETLADLRGSRFAFTDPLSNTGRLFPTYLLQQRFGVTPNDFFGSVMYSGGHDQSIHLVDRGVVDGASVDEQVLRLVFASSPHLATHLVVIERSPPFGSPPIVARSDLPQELIDGLHDALMVATDDPDLRALMRRIDADRFVAETDYSFAAEVAAVAIGMAVPTSHAPEAPASPETEADEAPASRTP